jgi:cysteine desulfurase
VIYLDHHATTPVDARVLEAMLPYFTGKFGNAATRHHRLGWEANDAVERARRQVAALIGAGSKDVIFTSGATEANNLAIKGAARARRAASTSDGAAPRDHLVTVATEHKAVLDPMARLAAGGWRVTVLPVAASGLIDLAALEGAVTERTALVSVMAANNEIGVLQPIREAAAIAHAKGAWFHSDAVQAAGRVPFDVEALGVDFASVSAHKIYGPKGVGALYVRRKRVTVLPEIDGGGHERGLRSGTLNVPGIVGFGRAAEIARAEMPAEARRVGELRDRLLAHLQTGTDGITLNGTLAARLPGNLNVSFAGIDGEALLVSLDDVAVSSGAACTQAEPSHVLTALGLTTDRALASLRFGIGRSTTSDEVDEAARKVNAVVARLRHLSPARRGAAGASARSRRSSLELEGA